MIQQKERVVGGQFIAKVTLEMHFRGPWKKLSLIFTHTMFCLVIRNLNIQKRKWISHEYRSISMYSLMIVGWDKRFNCLVVEYCEKAICVKDSTCFTTHTHYRKRDIYEQMMYLAVLRGRWCYGRCFRDAWWESTITCVVCAG